MYAETASKDFEIQARGVDRTLSDIRRLIGALRSLQAAGYTALYILERLGLPRNIAAAIRVLLHFYATLQAVQVALTALEVQLGPAGWVLIGLGVATGAILMEV